MVNVRGEKRLQIIQVLRNDPKITFSEVAARFDTSRQWVSYIAGVEGIDARPKPMLRSRVVRINPERPCVICGELHTRHPQYKTCSEQCSYVLKAGRRYLDPKVHESQRRSVARYMVRKTGTPSAKAYAERVESGETPPNRRFHRPNSKIAQAMRAVGLGHLLP